ncbi:hypothetical protein HDE_12331 [Halotydeus destructor]|nr:hypothetical protein HDE_12331 [Halotydeus destructor]
MPPDPDARSSRDDEICPSDVPVVDLTIGSDSDDDDEPQGFGYAGMEETNDNGYEMLPLDPESLPEIETGLEASDEAPSFPHPSTTVSEEPTFTREWDMIGRLNQSETVQKDPLPMSDEHVEKIKSVMASIKLPECAAPSWASNVPEDEWLDFVKIRTENKK